MAIIKGSDGTLQEVERSKAARVAAIHAVVDPTQGGRYRIAVKSGSLSAIAAAAPLLGFRNPTGSGRSILIDRLALRLQVDTDFTAAQLLGLGVFFATAFPTQFSAGGFAALPASGRAKKRTNMVDSIAGLYAASTVFSLTGGSQTIDTVPMIEMVGHAPAAGTTVENVPIVNTFIGTEDNGPIIIAPGEGFVIRNNVAMGAAGTMVFSAEIAWREMLEAKAADY